MTTTRTRRRTLRQLADDLKDRKARVKETKEAHDNAKQACDTAERELLQRLEEEELGSFRTADGTQFVPTKTIYSQVQDWDAFHEWAVQNHPELLDHRKHYKGLLHDLVRTAIDDGDEAGLPPGVSFYVDEYVSQRAA